MSSSPDSDSNDGLSLYLKMLLSFGTVPKWHNSLSTLFIWMITTGFIIIPSSLVGISTIDGETQPVLVLELNAPLFKTGISLVFIGVIGMFVLSCSRLPIHIPLKDNYFWLYNKYYLRVAEGGIYGVILLIVIIVELRKGSIDRPTTTAICITCFLKVLYCGLAIWSYWKLRQVKKAHEESQPQAEKPQTEDPYVEMLLGFMSLPAWHILLSTFLIWLITTAFITVPPALISFAENSDNSDDTSLFQEFVQSEPLFGIGVSIFFVGFIGMFVLSRYRYLKNNHFWLYHNYYRRMVEAGLFGVVSLLVSIFVLGEKVMDAPTVAVICVTCIVTTFFSVLASLEYDRMRQAMKAHEAPQPQAEVTHLSGSP